MSARLYSRRAQTETGLYDRAYTRPESSMPAATAGFAQMVAPHRGRVASLIVVHGHTSTRVDPNHAYLHGVHLCSANDLEATLEQLLVWLNGDGDEIYLAPRVFHTMHGQLKAGVAS